MFALFFSLENWFILSLLDNSMITQFITMYFRTEVFSDPEPLVLIGFKTPYLCEKFNLYDLVLVIQ